MFKSRTWSLRQHLNTALAVIASVAAQSEHVRLLHHKIAEAHTLHSSKNVGVQFFYARIVLLTHMSHDSILWSAIKASELVKNFVTRKFSPNSATVFKMVGSKKIAKQ